MYFSLERVRLSKARDNKILEYNQSINWRDTHVVNNIEENPKSSAAFIQNNVSLLRKKASPIEISGLPSYGKLSEDERALCSIARILPLSYLQYKEMLITENKRIGYLRLADARRLIKIDVNKTRQIYDFLLKCAKINNFHSC